MELFVSRAPFTRGEEVDERISASSTTLQEHSTLQRELNAIQEELERRASLGKKHPERLDASPSVRNGGNPPRT